MHADTNIMIFIIYKQTSIKAHPFPAALQDGVVLAVLCGDLQVEVNGS